MKVICKNNTGRYLRAFEYQKINDDNALGRFGVSAISEFNELTVDKVYLVMGIIIYQEYQAFLIDDDGFISSCPCQLFDVISDDIPLSWHFRIITKNESVYPYIQGICGYKELCKNLKSYENLIIEKDEESSLIYFQRKIELEQYYENLQLLK